MKRFITIIFALVLILPLSAQKQKKTEFSKVYSTKKFYFSGWGEPNKNDSHAAQAETLQKWSEAGITDLLPSVGTERLKELISMSSDLGMRIHAWHWMMNVGGSEECRENPE